MLKFNKCSYVVLLLFNFINENFAKLIFLLAKVIKYSNIKGKKLINTGYINNTSQYSYFIIFSVDNCLSHK